MVQETLELAAERERRRAYYRDNKQRILANAKARYDYSTKREYDLAYNRRPEVVERKRAQRKRWVQQNPEKYRASLRRKNHERRGAPPTSLGRDYIEILKHDPCAYCGGPMQHIDHVTPIARGGDGDWLNLTAACDPCNRSKGARPLLSWMLARTEY